VASDGLAAPKKARRTGKTIVFLDESGFLLQPTVRRTSAPKGQTPILRSWDRRNRLSVLSTLTCSTKRHRLGLYFSVENPIFGPMILKGSLLIC